MSVPYAAFPTAPKGSKDWLRQYDAWQAYEASKHGEVPQGDSGETQNNGGEDTSHGENNQMDKPFTYSAQYNLPGDEVGKHRTFKAKDLPGTLTREEATCQGRESLLKAHPMAKINSEKCNRSRGKSFAKGDDERRNKGQNGAPKQESKELGRDGDMSGQTQTPPKQEEKQQEQEEKAPPTGPDLMLLQQNAQPLLGQDAVDAIAAIAEQVSPKQTPVNIAEIVAKVREELGEMTGGEITIRDLSTQEFRKISGKLHPEFQDMLNALKRGQRIGEANLMLIGEAGTGKGYTARKITEALGFTPDRFGFVSCSLGMSEGHIQGRGLPLHDQLLYIQSRFVDIYENGGVFLLDEFDAADPNVGMVLNEALASGEMPVPWRMDNPVAKRHDDCYVIAAQNTRGDGQDLTYTARVAMDGATLNRFTGRTFIMDYDDDVEASVVASILRDGKARVALLGRFKKIRENLRRVGSERIWGTRDLKFMAVSMDDGDSLETVIARAAITWDETERMQAGIK